MPAHHTPIYGISHSIHGRSVELQELHGDCVSLEQPYLLEFLGLSIEHDYVFVAGNHQKAAIRCIPDALDWVISIEVKELDTFQLEEGPVIIVNLEDLKDTLIIANNEVAAIWRKVAAP